MVIAARVPVGREGMMDGVTGRDDVTAQELDRLTSADR